MTIQLDKLRRIGHHKLHRAVIDRLLHLLQIERLNMKLLIR